jgi:microsomal dipeptidase-like Zn-dependent dipeptidase
MRNKKDGLMSAVLTVEEGGAIQGNIDRLQTLCDEGVRMMTLTWNFENELAYPNEADPRADQDFSYYFRFQPRTDNGLKAKGFEAVREMERLGILPDVSHLSDAGFYDLAKTIKGPFVASHSNARALAGCNRNMTDDMIKITGNHGGVIGLNFCPAFLEAAAVEADCHSTVELLAKHAKHMINVGGREVVGLGTDFDGLGPEILEIQDASQLQKLVDVEDIKILEPEASVNRELILVKVRVEESQRQSVITMADVFRGTVVDVGKDSLIIELTGKQDKLEAFIRLLDGYEILELARTGITGLSRGSDDVRYFD